MTAWPGIPTPNGFKRILRVDVRQRLRGDLKLEREFRSGHVQHTYEFPWQVLTPAQRVTIDAFMVTVSGRYSSVTFTDPWDSSSIACRLDSDLLNMTAPSPVHWSGTLRLVETGSWQALKAPVATFPATVPCQQYSTRRRAGTVMQATEDGAELRYQDWASSIQSWGVGGDILTAAQVTDLLACWEGNCGPWLEFAWTDKETATLHSHCHFTETEITHTIISSVQHSLRCTVEEVKT